VGKKALPVGPKYQKRGEVLFNRHFSLLISTGVLPKGRNDWSSEAELRSATPNPVVVLNRLNRDSDHFSVLEG